MVMEYLDTGYLWFSKDLEIIRNSVTYIAKWLPWETELSLAILFLILSVFLSYKFISKFTTHPFSTQNIFYMLLLSFMMFTIFYYV